MLTVTLNELDNELDIRAAKEGGAIRAMTRMIGNVPGLKPKRFVKRKGGRCNKRPIIWA